jgi:endonuclease-3
VAKVKNKKVYGIYSSVDFFCVCGGGGMRGVSFATYYFPAISIFSNKNRIFAARMSNIINIIHTLAKQYPDAKTDLQHHSAFELLVATILSAQCTDKRVNEVTPSLFVKYPNPQTLANADQYDVEQIIYSTGFYKNKAKNLIACSQTLVNNFNGSVPQTMDELLTLPGVGRKTANCILGNCFVPVGIVVDTHVVRITNLLGLVDTKNPEKIEKELMQIVPKKYWVNFTHYIIRHGRATCIAHRPQCNDCCINQWCEHYKFINQL